LKEIAKDLLPREIVNREKFPFHAPGSSYLLKQKIDWVEELLSPELIRKQGYFNPLTVERLKRQYLKEGFKLDLPIETDLLMIVLTFGMFLEAFKMPYLN
jgi:asparagine synthase (glutamine-hydrolysing)